jgi:hypothetical protein
MCFEENQLLDKLLLLLNDPVDTLAPFADYLEKAGFKSNPPASLFHYRQE